MLLVSPVLKLHSRSLDTLVEKSFILWPVIIFNSILIFRWLSLYVWVIRFRLQLFYLQWLSYHHLTDSEVQLIEVWTVRIWPKDNVTGVQIRLDKVRSNQWGSYISKYIGTLLIHPSNHPSIFFSIYPTQGCEDPAVYLKGLKVHKAGDTLDKVATLRNAN